jgi:histidinol dehydrogenase
MMRTLDLRGTRPSRSEFLALLPRPSLDVDVAIEVAASLISDVREGGSRALRDQALRLDGVSSYDIVVSEAARRAALEDLNPALRVSLETAIARVRRASEAQVPPTIETTVADGARITQRWIPVDRVGLYVPGGKAVYPSSVIMNVVAAQTAGVQSIALVSPPQAQFSGGVHPTILAVAQLLGISEIYAMGGAGAVGALAYGVPDLNLQPVNVITGPGNVYVAAAKRLVRGRVGIDSEAGPTEILVIADSSASARIVAADLISQAEHDELASSILVTDSQSLIEHVRAELEVLVPATRHAERVNIALNGQQSAFVLVDELDVAVDFSNAYGPEHLEIHALDTHKVLEGITNAGAIFLGDYSPVSLGDYSAGSNHVLPTAGQALFSSGLGAYTFLRAQQVVEYSREALAELAAGIRLIAEDENLPAHADAIDARFAPRGA